MISAWERGLVGMCVFEKRKLTVPASSAYGSIGNPDLGIPPDATLVINVELLGISDKAPKNNKGREPGWLQKKKVMAPKKHPAHIKSEAEKQEERRRMRPPGMGMGVPPPTKEEREEAKKDHLSLKEQARGAALPVLTVPPGSLEDGLPPDYDPDMPPGMGEDGRPAFEMGQKMAMEKMMAFENAAKDEV